MRTIRVQRPRQQVQAPPPRVFTPPLPVRTVAEMMKPPEVELPPSVELTLEDEMKALPPFKGEVLVGNEQFPILRDGKAERADVQKIVDRIDKTVGGGGGRRVFNKLFLERGVLGVAADVETITVDPANVGGVLQKHIVRRVLGNTEAPMIEGDETSSPATRALNYTILSALMASGQKFDLRRNSSYGMGGRIALASGAGLFGSGFEHFVMPAAVFNNTDPAVFGAATSALFTATGLLGPPYTPVDDVTLEGFHIRSEVSDGRSLEGVAARNVTKLRLLGIEVSGLPIGRGYRINSCPGFIVDDGYVHDSTSAVSHGGGEQISGIEVDGDVVNSIGSESFEIRNFRAEDLTMTGALLIARGDQTDGANIGQLARYGRIVDMRARGVNEGIDNFAKNLLIRDFIARKITGDCIKLTHGASYVQILGGLLREFVLRGLYIAATGDAAMAENYIGGGIRIELSDYLSTAVGTTACIRVDDNAQVTNLPTGTVIGDVRCVPGNGAWAIALTTTQRVDIKGPADLEAGTSGRIYRTNLTGSVCTLQQSNVKAYLVAATQSIPSATQTVIVLDTPVYDAWSEFSASGWFIVREQGLKHFFGVARVVGVAALKVIQLHCIANGVVVGTKRVETTGASEEQLIVNADFYAAAGHTVKLVIEHNDATAKNVSGGLTLTWASMKSLE